MRYCTQTVLYFGYPFLMLEFLLETVVILEHLRYSQEPPLNQILLNGAEAMAVKINHMARQGAELREMYLKNWDLFQNGSGFVKREVRLARNFYCAKVGEMKN